MKNLVPKKLVITFLEQEIPIKSDSDLDISSIGKAPVLNLAWHISSEIKSYMKTLGYEGLLIDVISDADFDSN